MTKAPVNKRRGGFSSYEIMTTALEKYLVDGVYTGPTCFKDGFVFKLENGEPVFPDTLPEGFAGDTLERAFSDKNHNGGRIEKADNPSEEELAELEYEDPAAFMKHFFMAFIGEIGDGYYYTSLNEADEFYDYLSVFSYSEALIAAAEEAFGGAVLILDVSDPRLPFTAISSYFGEHNYAADLGITLSDVTSRKEVLVINGQPYRCSYRASESFVDEILIFARPDESDWRETALRFAPVAMLMLVFFTTLSVYVVAVQAYVRDHILSKKRAGKYRSMKLMIPCTESLERIEAILAAELPKIGSRMDKIISGPIYYGVSDVSTSSQPPRESVMTLAISAECLQKDYFEVKKYVYREVLLLCQREHIPLT